MSVPNDGPNDEWIKVKCIECGDALSGPRRNIKLGRDERDEDWKIERGEHGEIVATCDDCRETDPMDGSGEHDV